MSSRKSKLRKILHKATQLEERQRAAREKHRLPGETDEDMEERMKRDLFGFVDMMSDREIEDGLRAKAKELKELEDMQSKQLVKDEQAVTAEHQEENTDG